jgi:hypothetical protein
VQKTNAIVSFTGIPGCLHDLLWITDLRSNNWATAASNIVFAPGKITVTNTFSPSETNRFYRVKANY